MNVEKLIDDIQKEISSSPDDPTTHYKLGVVYAKNGLYEESNEAIRVAINLDKNNFKYYQSIGYNCLKLKCYNDALMYLETAIKINPDDATVYNYLGVTYEEKKDELSAVTAFIRSTELDSENYAAFYNLGRLYSHSGNFEKSINPLKKACEINPSFQKTYEWLIHSLLKLHKNDEALNVCKEGLKTNSSNAEFYFFLGKSFGELGDVREAILSIERSISLNPNEATYYHNLGYAYHITGQVEKAKCNYKKALELHPNFPEVKANLNQLQNQDT